MLTSVVVVSLTATQVQLRKWIRNIDALKRAAPIAKCVGANAHRRTNTASPSSDADMSETPAAMCFVDSRPPRQEPDTPPPKGSGPSAASLDCPPNRYYRPNRYYSGGMNEKATYAARELLSLSFSS